MDERTIETITKKVLEKLVDTNGSSGGNTANASGRSFPVGVSARHCHLSKNDLETLFGVGYELQVLRMLKQPDQFAAKETVTLVGPKRTLYGVRILGPARSKTQVEISLTDGFSTGLKPPVKDSGKLDGTPGAVLVGPKGSVQLTQGIIAAARHIHVEPARAQAIGIKDQQRVKVRVNTANGRSLVFDNVLVRSGSAHLSEFHVDTDEANAAGLRNGDEVEVLL